MFIYNKPRWRRRRRQLHSADPAHGETWSYQRKWSLHTGLAPAPGCVHAHMVPVCMQSPDPGSVPVMKTQLGSRVCRVSGDVTMLDARRGAGGAGDGGLDGGW